MKYPFYFLICLSLGACKSPAKDYVEVHGELKQWHKLTLEIRGPETSEYARENPFLDYKLDVFFSNGSRSYKVPGYFAADGNAAETSAMEGNVWKVHFRPDLAGSWTYRVSFKRGKNMAVVDGGEEGDPLGADGVEGTLDIEESDKTGADFRARGRIINGGKGYFKFQDSDQIWIKNGADSPENFLAYEGFDQTSRFSLKSVIREGEADPKKSLHRYEPHLRDWNEGDPSWKNGKGKGIIGAVNYLHSAGVNSIYMLTMNIIGDGKDVWPYTDYNERYRFDCSKLDQWELVFDHMEKLGIMAHFVLQETENECLLDMGHTGVQRRVYLRELIARFGHHLAVSWNLGEENGPAPWTPIGQTEEQKKAMAEYLKEINPYPSLVVLHTHADDAKQDEYLTPLLGFESLDGPSLQIGNPAKVHERVKKWVNESENAGMRWLVNLDEIGPAWKGVMPDSHDAHHDTIRHQCLWATLVAGGTGVEWYFGYRFPHNDLGLEDFRSRSNWWKQSSVATQFISSFPLEEMQGADNLVMATRAYCLAKPGELYLVYLPAGTSDVRLHLATDRSLTVKWFNPREGGELQEGSISAVKGRGSQNLGKPPSDPSKDWVIVVQSD